jgi:hypothetical protein|tara:strand:- start:68 stop:346 length:279 start_codon:yes stop_codon:yes gene_type:complete
MKITKQRLTKIIKEEMSTILEEGLQYEGLMEIMVDHLRETLSSFQPEAKAVVYEEIESKGLDLTRLALKLIDDELGAAGPNPGGSIGAGGDI